MTDPERVAAIEEGLASEDDEEVFSALVDIGKHGHREMIDRVVPYLASPTDFLREAAVRTLVFYFHLPEYKADAIRLLDSDPDEGVRQVAAMGLRMFAAKDPELLQHLLAVALNPSEEDIVRDAAFVSALVASGGIERSEFPMGDWLPGFEAKADWPLLERALRKGGVPVPPGVTERAARKR
jgi:HEAT repeat protein